MKNVHLHLIADKETPIEIEALQLDTMYSESIAITCPEIPDTMKRMNLDFQPLSSQNLKGNSTTLLIGSDYYWDIVTGNVKPVVKMLKAVETKLGWSVQRPLP